MTVETIAFGGEGIVKENGKTIFVPYTAPGDTISYRIVKDHKSYAKAELTKIHTASPQRTKPPCPHFTICNGCQLQHIEYQAQLSIKKTFVTDALTRIGKFTPPTPSITPSENPYHYRSHHRFNLQKKQHGYELGYITKTGFLPLTTCPIGSVDIPHLQNLLTTLNHTQSMTLRVFTLAPKPLLAFSCHPSPPSNATEWIHTNLSQTSGIVFKSPRKTIDHTNAPYSPFAFMQCNPPVAEAIQTHILTTLPPKGHILDLYGGSGHLSSLLTTKGYTATLVEKNPHGLPQKPSFTVLNTTLESATLPAADASIVNPPREGLTPQALKKLTTPQITYISCNPATLARDSAHLIDRGYKPTTLHLFDMFPQTTHIETCLTFTM